MNMHVNLLKMNYNQHTHIYTCINYVSPTEHETEWDKYAAVEHLMKPIYTVRLKMGLPRNDS